MLTACSDMHNAPLCMQNAPNGTGETAPSAHHAMTCPTSQTRSRPAPILVSRAQGVQGNVSLDPAVTLFDNFAATRSRSSPPPVPWEVLWDFAKFRPILRDLWENRGRGTC